MKTQKQFNATDIKNFAPLEKLGLYATVNLEGKPHITFMNSLMAQSTSKLTFGQFVKGNSKWYMQNNPKMAFFILSPPLKKMWIGKCLWTHKKSEGTELENYKKMPMQRYNSYFPINMVHYLDLVETTKALKIPVPGILIASILTTIGRMMVKTSFSKPVLSAYAEKLCKSITSMNFLSYINKDGFPEIIPIFECQAADHRRLVFSPGPFKKELFAIPTNTEVAVLSLSMKLESVLTRGTFNGFKRYNGLKLGTIDITWVYNSMPPNAGQIYPKKELKAVTSF